MKWSAFLRGINISGKNKIDMKDLKVALEHRGFMNVHTFLNSGNVSFESEEKDPRAIIEELILDIFSLHIPVYVITWQDLRDILQNAPSWWDAGSKDRYDNLIFILSSDTPEEVNTLLGQPSSALERVQFYRNVIFWSFDRRQYQKCHWWKATAAVGIAEKLTIRTANTVRKVCG